MLSNWELEDIHRTLDNNPPKAVEKRLNDLLVQHGYALKYPPFTPLLHHRQFLNRKTDERTLDQIIDVAKGSTTILLDTESTPIHRQPNRPSLIQLQLNPADALPTVVIVEANHLPPTNSNAFQQMQDFFRIVLDSNNVIYTWGTIEELEPFVQFGLFTTQQITQPDNEDLQGIFKDYWRRCHPHKSTEDCKCEKCLGRKPDQKWKLLDAVAHQLNEWLDKRYTRSSFDIGLDPRLKRLRPEQMKYRTTLTNYAANDVLSMEQLMNSMEEQVSPSELTRPSTTQTKETPPIIHQDVPELTEAMTITLLIHTSSSIVNPSHQLIPSLEQADQKRRTGQTDQQHRSEETDQQLQPEQADQQHRSKQTDQQHRSEQADQQHRLERTKRQLQSERTDRHQQLEQTNQRHRSDQIDQRNETKRHRTEHIDEQHRTELTNQGYRPYQSRRIDQQRRTELINQLRQLKRNNGQHQQEKDSHDRQRKIENRINTIRQRQRNYTHEIIRRGIDPRFNIDIVKEILCRYGVPYTAVNISKSKATGRKSLYIGIKHECKVHEYERRTRNLFTTEYYDEFRARHRF